MQAGQPEQPALARIPFEERGPFVCEDRVRAEVTGEDEAQPKPGLPDGVDPLPDQTRGPPGGDPAWSAITLGVSPERVGRAATQSDQPVTGGDQVDQIKLDRGGDEGMLGRDGLTAPRGQLGNSGDHQLGPPDLVRVAADEAKRQRLTDLGAVEPEGGHA
jgi:hypothetical protein